MEREPEPLPDSNWVETSFGRDEFTNTEDEDRAKRRYTDTVTAKLLGVDSKDVRQWAIQNGLTDQIRGRLSKTVLVAYMAAEHRRNMARR
jgi:hypothetical protein